MARNTANLSFYCRESKKNKDGKAPIELSLIINKERCYIQLPRKESPDEFKRAVESRKGNSIKEYLDQIRHRVGEIEIELLRDAQPLSASALRQYFRCGGYQMYTVGNLFDEYLAILKKRVGKDMTQKTFRKYELARDKFYRIVKPSEPVAAITNASILDYIATMNETLDYVTSNGYAQRVKTVVQFGIDNNRIKVNPFSGVHLRKGEKSVQFLSDEEVALIRGTNFHNESLNRVRDLFVFQCSCGLSYCDMFKLEPSDYQVTDAGQYFIRIGKLYLMNTPDKPRKYIDISELGMDRDSITVSKVAGLQDCGYYYATATYRGRMYMVVTHNTESFGPLDIF